MIFGFTGKTGAGKTNTAVKEIFKQWKKGVTVHTNVPLFFSEKNERIHEFSDLEELHNVKDAIIFIDEAQTLVDAYEWQSLSKSFRYKLTQHRKQGVDLYCTFQSIGSIHIKLRQLIHEMTLCQKLFRYPFNDRKLATIQIYKKNKIKFKEGDDESKNIAEKGAMRFGWITKWQDILYDTNALVGLHKYRTLIKISKKGVKIKFV